MNSKLLNKMEQMSKREIYNAIYTDHLTGVLNRRAFECDERPAFAVVDLDSLKFINDNFGHRAGDDKLKLLALVLVSVFDKDSVYRLGSTGDEFAIKGSRYDVLEVRVAMLTDTVPFFSYGVGRSLQNADKKLIQNKKLREANGMRAPRGERPPWFNPEVKKQSWGVHPWKEGFLK